jgi:predicted TIM-barrel fold metal-dependent hydrolase
VIYDTWINVQSPAAARLRASSPVLNDVTTRYFHRDDALKPRTFADAVDDMDSAGVDQALISASARLGSTETSPNYSIEEAFDACARWPSRLRAALFLDGLPSIAVAVRRIEESARSSYLRLVQVTPLTLLEPINSPRLYPIYACCEALGVPVSINVGLPGPRVSARLQEAILLDDVLLDFPGLTVLAAHMGHPWESLIIGLMRKYEKLHLTNSAYLATYMSREVIDFMNSSVGHSRVLFGSDAPMIPLTRAVEAARQLPLSPRAMAGFLGANAERLLARGA